MYNFKDKAMSTLKQECKELYDHMLYDRTKILSTGVGVFVYSKYDVNFSDKNWEVSFVEFLSLNKLWIFISRNYKLSNRFITRYGDRMDWFWLYTKQKIPTTMYQKLSEREHIRLTNFFEFQKISIEDIEKILAIEEKELNINKFSIRSLILRKISKYQKLSESFILKYFNDLDKYYISKYQKLSAKLRKDKGIVVPDTCWLYKDVNFFRNYIKENTDYTIETDTKGDYIIAYKGIRSDRYSKYNFSYRYLKGKTYSSHCDCNVNEEDSFGLSAWTEEYAKNYCDELVVRVKIYLKDIGCFVYSKPKIRCRKLTVLD